MAGHEKSSGGMSGSGSTSLLSIDVQVGLLRDAASQLADAIRNATDKGSESLDNFVNKVFEQADKIRQARMERKGASQDEPSELTQAYDKAVCSLRDAAREGQQEASRALKKLGERIEPAPESKPHKK